MFCNYFVTQGLSFGKGIMGQLLSLTLFVLNGVRSVKCLETSEPVPDIIVLMTLNPCFHSPAFNRCTLAEMCLTLRLQTQPLRSSVNSMFKDCYTV